MITLVYKSKFSIFHLSYILLSTLADGNAMMKADVEDFRILAKQLVPQRVAEKLVDFVARKAEKLKNVEYERKREVTVKEEYDESEYEEDVSDPAFTPGFPGPGYEGQKPIGLGIQAPMQQYISQQWPQTSDPPMPKLNPRAALKTVKVNFDGLVEKVREKLLLDFNRNGMFAQNQMPQMVQTNNGEYGNVQFIPPGNGMKQNPIQNNMQLAANTDANAYTDERIKVEAYNKPKKTVGDVEKPRINYNQHPKKIRDTHILTQKGQRPDRIRHLTRQANPTPAAPTLYDQFDLKKNDSYEDYVTPKKDYNQFESYEDAPSHSLKTPQLTEPRYNYRPEHEAPQDKLIKPKLIKLTDNDEPENVLSRQTERQNERHFPRKTTRYSTDKVTFTFPETPSTDKPVHEYVDDVGPTIRPELGARTENINDDYGDDMASKVVPKVQGYNEEVPRKSSKLATMIPTRETYKMSSPNYYGQLPTIAEVYNFKEPIPEIDRQEENLKPIGNPPANINNKVRVK